MINTYLIGLVLLACVTIACGDPAWPTAPTREVPSFYSSPQPPPIEVDRSRP